MLWQEKRISHKDQSGVDANAVLTITNDQFHKTNRKNRGLKEKCNSSFYVEIFVKKGSFLMRESRAKIVAYDPNASRNRSI